MTILRTHELDDDAVRFSYSTSSDGDRFTVTEGALHEIYLALRSTDQLKAERVGQDLLAQMRASREEKKEPVA